MCEVREKHEKLNRQQVLHRWISCVWVLLCVLWANKYKPDHRYGGMSVITVRMTSTWSPPAANVAVSLAYHVAHMRLVSPALTCPPLTWWRDLSLSSCPHGGVSDPVLICVGFCLFASWFQAAAVQSHASIQSALWVTPEQSWGPAHHPWESSARSIFFLFVSQRNLIAYEAFKHNYKVLFAKHRYVGTLYILSLYLYCIIQISWPSESVFSCW